MTMYFQRGPERRNSRDAHYKHALTTHYVECWKSNALMDSTGKADYYAEKLDVLADLIPDRLLRKALPTSETRPVLAAAVVDELSSAMLSPDQISFTKIKSASSIVTALDAKYAPIMMDDFLRTLAAKPNPELNAGELLELIIEGGGTNSTLRNIFLAHRLNDTVFKGTDIEARLAMTHYTWRELNAKVSRHPLPDLPEGSSDSLNLRLCIGIVANGRRVSYFDYGHAEGRGKYGLLPTGEGIGRIVGIPAQLELISPKVLRDVRFAVTEIGATQRHRPAEAESIRRLSMHHTMVRHLKDFTTTPEGKEFPTVVAAIDDLSDKQLTSVLKWSAYVEALSKAGIKIMNNQEIRATSGVIFTPFSGRRARVEAFQPSTRSVTAASDAARALGMLVDLPTNSSREKGESAHSEGVTLTAHNVDVVLRRDKGFEEEAIGLRKLGDDIPVHISLGGDAAHPTQTLGEIKTLMDYYQCASYSLEELRERTREAPPTFSFIGRIDQKRADKALIKFILSNLPDWSVRVIVPFESDLPTIAIPKGANCTFEVNGDLKKESAVISAVQGSRFIYTSNPEATSKVDEKGKGDGKEEAPYFISSNVLDKTRCALLHPLPASSEIEGSIFKHSGSLITRQMVNKVFVIASLIGHQLSAKDERYTPASFYQ